MPLTDTQIKSLKAVASSVRKANGGIFREIAPDGTKVFRLPILSQVSNGGS